MITQCQSHVLSTLQDGEIELLGERIAEQAAHLDAANSTEDARPQDDEQRRYVRRRDTYDGMVKIEAVLHPEEAELVWAMLDHAAKHLAHEPRPQPAADASVSDTATVPASAHGPPCPTG